MKLLLRRVQLEWASWLAVLFIALLPFGRWSEVPLSLFALSLPFLWRIEAHRQVIRRVTPFVVLLFLVYAFEVLFQFIARSQRRSTGRKHPDRNRAVRNLLEDLANLSDV